MPQYKYQLTVHRDAVEKMPVDGTMILQRYWKKRPDNVIFENDDEELWQCSTIEYKPNGALGCIPGRSIYELRKCFAGELAEECKSKFGHDYVWEICGVDNRCGIFLRSGRTTARSNGGIVVGDWTLTHGTVGRSAAVYKDMYEKLDSLGVDTIRFGTAGHTTPYKEKPPEYYRKLGELVLNAGGGIELKGKPEEPYFLEINRK